MSIASEITRLNQAKQSLKSALEKHGATVEAEAKLEEYSALVEALPFAVKAEFTPEEDTGTFEISGLVFEPVSISMYCKQLSGNPIAKSVSYAYGLKGYGGMLTYYDNEVSRKFVNISGNSAVIQWGQNGVSINMPSPDSSGYFKKGYAYDFIVTGGF